MAAEGFGRVRHCGLEQRDCEFDRASREIVELVNKLAGKVESGFLVGGLTSSRKQNVQVADGMTEGGISGVSFSDSVTVATRSATARRIASYSLTVPPATGLTG